MNVETLKMELTVVFKSIRQHLQAGNEDDAYNKLSEIIKRLNGLVLDSINSVGRVPLTNEPFSYYLMIHWRNLLSDEEILPNTGRTHLNKIFFINGESLNDSSIINRSYPDSTISLSVDTSVKGQVTITVDQHKTGIPVWTQSLIVSGSLLEAVLTESE